MNILVTGGSSFTGLWFIWALAERGHSVTATFRQPLAAYQGIRRERVDLLGSLGVRRVESCSFGDDTFLSLVKEGVDILCHHGANVEGYKSLDFDVGKALRENSANLQHVLEAARESEVRGIILTGSVFEQDEGAGEGDRRAFSPYGLSKGLTWQVFRFWSRHFNLPLHKFVVPNPFGPYEEPRFCQYLIDRWSKGETPQVNTPSYVRDNIHISLLAKIYARFVENCQEGKEWRRLAPSQYVESQGAFANRFAQEIGSRLGIPTPLILGEQTDFSEPVVRINLDRMEGTLLEWNERKSWDDLATYYQKRVKS